MQILISVTSNKKIVIKQRYNHILQGLVYQFLNKVDSTWLHNVGFHYNNRNFKLFVFSEILERGVVNNKNKTFEFPQKISFYLSSPVDWILTQFASNILRTYQFKLGSNIVSVESISVMKKKQIKSMPITVKAITPIEVHSTIIKPDGKKLTHYYTPFEKEFSILVNENLKKKWRSYYKKEAPGDIIIRPLFTGSKNERIRYFRKTVIKGWVGFFEINGNIEMAKFAIDAGLGSRNSQGFGMVKIKIF